jgi:hypothetical protein
MPRLLAVRQYGFQKLHRLPIEMIWLSLFESHAFSSVVTTEPMEPIAAPSTTSRLQPFRDFQAQKKDLLATLTN